MQNHRPARLKKKRVRMPWTAPYTSIPHINGPAARAGPSVDRGQVELSGPCRLADLPDDRLGPAAEEASVGRHPVADPGADCPAAVGSASAGSDCSYTFSCLLVAPESPDVNAWNRRKLRRKTADCACETRTDSGANFAKVPLRIESAFTPACKHDRGRRARDRWARRAPFRPRRKIRCDSRPI